MLVVAKGLYGLGGNIAVLAEACRLGELLHCDVAADWVGGMYAVDGANVADLLFSHPRLVSLPDDLRERRVFPPQWQDEIERTMPRRGVVDGLTLSRATADLAEGEGLEALAETYDVVVVSRDSAHWYTDELVPQVKALEPNRTVLDAVDALGVGSDDIAVHFRHGNGERTVVPPDIGWFFTAVDRFLGESPDSRVLLCTDAEPVLRRFMERYGQDRVYASAKEYPEPGSGGMHYGATSEDRYRSAVEAAVDMWAMGRCGYLVGSRSFFTGVAMKLAHPIDRSRIAAWVPTYRSHTPPRGHTPVLPDSDLGRRLTAIGIPLDGLFVASKDGETTLHYLYWPIGTLTNAEDLDLTRVAEELSARRLY